MQTLLKFLRLLLWALALAGALQPAQAQTRQVKLRVDYIPTGIYAGFHYAQQRGYYAKEGLSVEVLPGNGSNATMDGLLRGDIEVGFGGCWAFAIGISKGRDVVSVATFTGKNGFAFFHAADPAIKTLKDLNGKTIVVSPASFETYLYPSVLAAAGLPADALRRVNVDPAQKIATYTRGQADVVVTHYAASAPLIDKQRPSGYISWSSAGFTLPDFCISVTRERLNKEPQFVEKFLRATFAAAKDAAANPSDAAAAMVAAVPLLDAATTEKQWRLMTELYYSDDTRGCPHGWHSPSDWNKALDILKTYGGLEGDIGNHGRFYTNQFFSCNKR